MVARARAPRSAHLLAIAFTRELVSPAPRMDSENGPDVDDDFFGAQDETPESQQAERARELTKLERVHVAAGFRDAAEGAREAHLQEGFDEGFHAAAMVAAPAGFWHGAAAVLDAAAAAGIRPTDGGGDAAALRCAKVALRNGIRALELDGTVDGVALAERTVREAAPGIVADASVSSEGAVPGEAAAAGETRASDHAD